MPPIELVQGTIEWLDYRRYHVMSTDAAPIMGESPFKTAIDVWNEKMGNPMPEPSQKSKDAMSRGSGLEPIAREQFEKLQHCKVNPCVWQNDKYPWMSTSLDGLSEDYSFLIEIKCPGQMTHNMAKDGKMPLYYYPQIQHHFMCTGLSMGYYISYNPDDLNMPYLSFPIHANEEYMENLLRMEEEFWEKLLNFEEPVWRLK